MERVPSGKIYERFSERGSEVGKGGGSFRAGGFSVF